MAKIQKGFQIAFMQQGLKETNKFGDKSPPEMKKLMAGYSYFRCGVGALHAKSSAGAAAILAEMEAAITAKKMTATEWCKIKAAMSASNTGISAAEFGTPK